MIERDFNTGDMRRRARHNYATGRLFNKLANAKPYAHVIDDLRGVCVKCRITEAQIVDLAVGVCQVE